ncbi:MAG: OprD family outer membrane porin, partial [Campylobacterales bacterium]|nr:OprD family outer membrane porin [Campylobacterales bacterium]
AMLACMATASFAANDIASAFKEGKLDGRIRMHYMYTDWDKNGEMSGIDSQGLAVGGSLIYKTAPLYGLSAGVGFYTTQNPMGITEKNLNAKNGTASDLFSRGPGSASDFSKGYSVLAQSYLQYDISKTNAKVGRYLLTNPFVTPNDTKFIPIAVQGASVVVKELANTEFMVDYLTGIKERGMDNFQNMANTGDTPDAIKNYYHTAYNDSTKVSAGYSTGVKDAPNVSVVGVKNTSIKGLELQGWVMNWPDIVRQYVAEVNYGMKFGDFGLSFGGRFNKQSDQGAGDIIKPHSSSPYSTSGATKYKGDDDDKIDTYMYAVRAVSSYKAAKLLLAYSHTDKGGDLIAPWRAFPTDGYTRSMTQTDWNANTKAYKAQLDYDFNSLVSGVSALVSYSYYDRDPSKVPYQSMTNRAYGNGDTHQINFDVLYKVPYVKGLEWKVRTMIQHNDKVSNITGNTAAGTGTYSSGIGNDTSNKELRVEMNYFF